MNTQLPPDERERLHSLIREKLDLGDTECLAESTVVRELPGVDSMRLLRLLGAVELIFEVNLGFQAIPEVRTVRDIERLICESRERHAARTAASGGGRS